MRRLLVIPVFMAFWILLTVAALSWGFEYNWPDYQHVDHGLPLTWATHTLSTIAGPADTWSVDLSALAIDLALWLATMTLIVAVLLYKFRRDASASPAQPRQ